MSGLSLPAGFDTSYASGMNDAGWIVGSSGVLRGTAYATLWLPDNTPVNLDAWLDEVDPVEGAKWNLSGLQPFNNNGIFTGAYDINNNGIIVGLGTYNDGPGGLPDGPAGWVLDASALVPEPGTVALLALGVPVILRRSQRVRAS